MKLCHYIFPYLTLIQSDWKLVLISLTFLSNLLASLTYSKISLRLTLRSLCNHQPQIDNNTLLYKLYAFEQEVLPIRFCKVVFINAPPFIATFMNHAVVPFLTKKIKERVGVLFCTRVHMSSGRNHLNSF